MRLAEGPTFASCTAYRNCSRSYSGEFSSVFERCEELLRCMDVSRILLAPICFFDILQIPANLHENLLQATSLETEKCTFYCILFMFGINFTQTSALFHKHFAHAHREGIKDISPILGNFLLAAESEVGLWNQIRYLCVNLWRLQIQQTTDESDKQRFDAYISIAIDRKYL